MVTVLANGALTALEPVFAIATGLGVLAGAIAILMIGAPGLALLAAARPDGKLRNAPYLWLLPSVACTAILQYRFFNGAAEEFFSWATLFAIPYVAWAVLVGLGGLVHVVVHAGRFLFAPAKPLPRWEVIASKIIYGFAAIPAGAILLVGSALKGTLSMVAYSIIVMAVGVVIIRTDFERETTRWASTLSGRRFRRMLGSVALAILVPGNLVWTGFIIHAAVQPEASGAPVTMILFAVVPWVVATGAGILFHGSRPELAEVGEEPLGPTAPLDARPDGLAGCSA